MKNKQLYTTDETIGFITNTNNKLTTGKVYPDSIAIDEFKVALFPEKKVIKKSQPTLQQVIASAESRLKVFIESETNWQLHQMKLDNIKRNKHERR